MEKGVDIYIATDMLRLAYNNAYDVAILVSGDGDFSTAVEAVQDLGKHVENAISRSSISMELRRTCDVFVEITQDMFDRCSL